MSPCLLVFLSSLAHADSGWLLTTADFRQQPVGLEAIDGEAVRVLPVGADQPRAVAFEAFLQLDRPFSDRAVGGRFVLLGIAGQQIPGQPAGYANEQIVWKNPALGDLRIPLKQIRALVRAGRSIEGLDQAGAEDMVQMSNGDTVKGIIADFTDTKVKVSANGNDLEIPLDSVEWIRFALVSKPDPTPGRSFRVRLGDGTLLTAAALKTQGDQLALTLPDKSERTIPLSAVVGIEQLNGPVSWLSSRPPQSAEQKPFFSSLTWPARMDATVTGKPIQFGKQTFARGIGVHAYSKLEYALDGSYAAFRTQYALANDVKSQLADVTVRIKLDGKTVHEAEHVKAGVLSPVVTIDLPKEAKVLTLEVDYGEANDTQDRFNWIEPALVRRK